LCGAAGEAVGARAREARGKGNASATMESFAETPERRHESGHRHRPAAGRPSREYGRGLVQDVSSQLVGQFADCLKKQLAASTPEEAAAAVAGQTRPVGGLRLGLGAMWRSLLRVFRQASVKASPSALSRI
jgi:hypothetical protein